MISLKNNPNNNMASYLGNDKNSTHTEDIIHTSTQNSNISIKSSVEIDLYIT